MTRFLDLDLEELQHTYVGWKEPYLDSAAKIASKNGVRKPSMRSTFATLSLTVIERRAKNSQKHVSAHISVKTRAIWVVLSWTGFLGVCQNLVGSLQWVANGLGRRFAKRWLQNGGGRHFCSVGRVFSSFVGFKGSNRCIQRCGQP